MTKQIAVRLPEDLADFIDREVGEGRAASRATIVIRALERERRRALAARDVAILVAVGSESDWDGLTEYAARQVSGVD